MTRVDGMRRGLTRWRRDARSRPMLLAEAVAALGHAGVMARRHGEVSVAQIVGTVERSGDFDGEFRLRNRAMQGRWQQVAAMMDRGTEPPVELVQLGELYFVADGHHRVSVARAVDRKTVNARIVRICTIAYATACIRLNHLASKAAGRRFLERIPLPEQHRGDLWLDRPADWARLADAAEAWGFRQALDGRSLVGRVELATSWWDDEVAPVLRPLRDAGAPASLRDVQLYVTALHAGQQHEWSSWPPEPAQARELVSTLT